MTRLDRLGTGDADRWRAALPARACPMGSVEFVRILERQTGHAGQLFVLASGGARVAYPYLLRPVPPLPFAAGVPAARWDTLSPEYTGPMWMGEPSPGEASRFSDLFAESCREQGIVAEFAHLNPWMAAAGALDPACVATDREIVYLDLTRGFDHVWEHSLNTDARRATRQSARAGVTARIATTREDVLEFHRLHALTMERLSALHRYQLPPEYFLGFRETMPDNSFFVLAELEGRAIAGGLYLHGDDELYWHLSAADMEFQHARPVNACHLHAIRWGVEAGKRRLLCGGGYEAGDGVFRFKASFSPLRVPFQVHRRIHDPASYAALVEAWSRHHGDAAPRDGYFPAYRSSPPSPASPDGHAPVALPHA